ncbi:MAG: response regulator [Rhodocyclales bacterium]|nr:response regulator [Rhodocyclales bacterium]
MDKKPGTDPIKPNHAEATILVVDDEPANLGVLNAVLQPHFRVRVARSGAEALRVVGTAPRPDLVLLDVMMPEMDGYTVLAKLRESPVTRELPVIFVTAMDSSENEQHGLELGAVDYITKPISPAIVLARVHTQLELKAARDHLADQNARLEGLVAERTQALKLALDKTETAHAALKKSYLGTLMAISALAQLRGASIGEHSRRVADMSRQLARDMGLTEAEAQDVFVAALLHDIGKISFPDEMLKKPVNAMTAEQLAIYRRHPTRGADALAKIEALADIAPIVRYHHERYDGSGFPERRSGLDIPLGARIIAAVSDYDDFRSGALTTSPMTIKNSHRSLVEGRGRRYDPAVIDRLEPLLAFDEADEIDEIRVSAGHLQEGMLLTRDVMHPDGFLLLSKSTALERRLIDQLVTVERDSGRSVEIYVLRERVGR